MLKLLSLLSSEVWAMQPEIVEDWLNILMHKMHGEPLALSGQPGAGRQGFAVQDGIAVISLGGPLVKRNYGFDCSTSMDAVQNDLVAALADPNVEAILLDIDSPGGSVAGTQSLAQAVREAGAQKPVYAFCDGSMCSAAYWIGSAARRVAAQQTALVGSIGVVTVHVDRSEADAKAGIRRTFITAGQFKAMGNDASPLSDSELARYKTIIGSFYDSFLGFIAQARGLDAEKAEAWADGQVFTAEEALKAGLIDEITTLGAFLGRIKEEVRSMNLTEFAAKHPEAATQLRAEALAEAKTSLAAEAKDAKQAGRAEILALAGAVLGEAAEQKLAAVAEAGLNAAQVAAMSQVFGQPGSASAAQPEPAPDKKSQILAALQNATHGAVQSGPPAGAKLSEAELIQARARQIAGVK